MRAYNSAAFKALFMLSACLTSAPVFADPDDGVRGEISVFVPVLNQHGTGSDEKHEVGMGLEAHEHTNPKRESELPDSSVKHEALAVASDISLSGSVGKNRAANSPFADLRYNAHATGSMIDDSQVGNPVRVHFGPAATLLGSVHIDKETKGNPSRTLQAEALFMGSTGVQFLTDQCRVLLTAQAGGGAGTLGENGGRVVTGSSLYVNCRKYFDAALNYDRIASRVHSENGPTMVDVAMADVRTNFVASGNKWNTDKVRTSVGVRAEAILPHEEGGSMLHNTPVDKENVDARVQFVVGGAF